uniref:Uncharacterized protein n=1 Tax=Molossus molossus TaxID=27622 RepID=A0A7J8GQT6_MOLMO|nr:hypothetical protein HJG59_011306 [Molossus molossus]
MTEQSTTMNMCELCTCDNGTLSCIVSTQSGDSTECLCWSPTPIVAPSSSQTFKETVSYIDEDTWKSYRLVEKPILSGNTWSELCKNSFEGLLSLQYLDLSCNKMKFTERNTFKSLPVLQYINLGCNFITKLSFGTF